MRRCRIACCVPGLLDAAHWYAGEMCAMHAICAFCNLLDPPRPPPPPPPTPTPTPTTTTTPRSLTPNKCLAQCHAPFIPREIMCNCIEDVQMCRCALIKKRLIASCQIPPQLWSEMGSSNRLGRLRRLIDSTGLSDLFLLIARSYRIFFFLLHSSIDHRCFSSIKSKDKEPFFYVHDHTLCHQIVKSFHAVTGKSDQFS